VPATYELWTLRSPKQAGCPARTYAEKDPRHRVLAPRGIGGLLDDRLGDTVIGVDNNMRHLLANTDTPCGTKAFLGAGSRT
jgi:hypothetical protein